MKIGSELYTRNSKYLAPYPIANTTLQMKEWNPYFQSIKKQLGLSTSDLVQLIVDSHFKGELPGC